MFESDTLNRPPFTYNYRNYAVCPACLNPVQIIGVKTELRNTPEPYAKHTTEEIPGLDAVIDEVSYRNCPYADPNSRQKNQRYTLRSPSYLSKLIIELFWTQLDRIFYIIERELPISIPWHLKKQILKDFVGYKGWRHPEITLLNVPWMLLYCSNYYPLWRCEIKDEKLRLAISKIKGVEFEENNTNVIKHDGRDGLGFCVIHHRIFRGEHANIRESINFVVAKNLDQWFFQKGILDISPSNEILFSKTLEIKADYFYNLTHPSNPQYEKAHKRALQNILPLLEQVHFPKMQN